MGKLWISKSNGCWIELFDATLFTGNSRRLHGPGDFPYLRIGDEDWNDNVLSLAVGPNAYVQCYEDLNFHDSVFWLLPNQKVEDLAGLDCGDDIDCVRIFDRPPFAHEPGYAAYMLWAASHLAKMKA